MALRARLTAALAVAVLLPVTAAAIVLAVVLPHSSRDRTDAKVLTARAEIAATLQEVCRTQVRLAASLAVARGDLDVAATTAARQAGSAAVIYGANGSTLVSAARAGSAAPSLIGALRFTPDCAATGSVGGPQVVAARVTRHDGGVAVVGRAIAPNLAGGPSDAVLADLTAASHVDVATATSGATTGVVHAGGRTSAALPLTGGVALVASTASPDTTTTFLVISVVGLVVLLLAALVCWRLARSTTRPLDALAGAAERVTAGDLEFRLPADGDDEVARLSAAFNTMTEALRRTITDLRTSRDELQRNVARLGDTLSSTHDLDRILGVIVDTAMVGVRATAGALLLTSGDGATLFLRVARGLDGRVDGVPASEPLIDRTVRNGWSNGLPGVVSRVARSGEALRGRVGPDVAVAVDEPSGRCVLALPLRSGGRVTGVLALYDRSDGQPFDDRDVQIVDSFVRQAVTAVDNVLLHQEAQRLSITDGLTGLWNYRYAVLALGREVERASRFDRPLAVLMLDLDRFKRVNDQYGHQRGDAVLLEVANRVRTVVREVDILARYGGEELVLVLPETDLAGAEFLAGRVREAIGHRPIGGPGEEPLHMTASIGVAVFPRHGTDAREVLRAADTALYAAKAAGRDRYEVAGSAPAEQPGDPRVPVSR